ncbi:hypothetical protein [Teredinibacter purpureus]|jgi:hypothetical protein|uniref:hypothetical protein n=1 Tax=Teredinibacter purpureus TaxID=2731756 RepID=UPI0005F8072B|nr:hypothetical protein [Teredinibacter purpureus]
MNECPIGDLNLKVIIQRKLAFLLGNDIAPWDEHDQYDLGKRDALQTMLNDSDKLTEQEFELKYLEKVAVLNSRIEGENASTEDDDDYYEAFSNALTTILVLINPINLYDLTKH